MMMTEPLLARIQKLTVQHFTLEIKIYSLKSQHLHLFSDYLLLVNPKQFYATHVSVSVPVSAV